MPRNTCRPSECAAASQDEPEASANNNNNHSNNNNNNEGIIKQELEAAPPVCHRKSERRRVARDIFLVFEEQTTRRRGKGARGKATRAKQKFGHLKVANTPRINKNVLRDIKTEPKCSSEAVVPAAAPAIIPIPALNPPIPPQIAALNPPLPEEPTLAKSLPRTAAVKLETKTHVTSTATASNVAAPKRISPKPKAPSVQEKEKEVVSAVTPASLPIPKPAAAPATSPTTPSVNPIFLWVKQDDTRIVEVRCEDYDKRNRIRLTKTTNGWRSMPRTDASSTRIVKFFHGSAAPLMKVKREQHLQRLEEEEQQHQEQELQQAEDHEREQEQTEQQMPSIGQTLLQDWDDSATQLPDEIEEQEEEEEGQESDAAQHRTAT